MRRSVLKWLALSGVVAMAGIAASPAGASSDYVCGPDWSLENGDLGCWGTAAIAPGNDTRINLAYLVRDARGLIPGQAHYVKDDWRGEMFGRSFFDWGLFRQSFWKGTDDSDPGNPYYGSRCVSLKGGDSAFAAALEAAGRPVQADSARLLSARATLSQTCKGEDGRAYARRSETNAQPVQFPAPFGQGEAREFFDYAAASNAFYAGDWAAARAAYAQLGDARNPWVRETARYMLARVALNAALEGTFDDWGWFDGVDKADKAQAKAAGEALAAYLAAYPKGLYAASARGLQRRALWLQGDKAALAKTYSAMLAGDDFAAPQTAGLLDEVDNKLFDGVQDPRSLGDPLLIATWDLQHMRTDEWGEAKPMDAGLLDAQAPLFKGHEDLYQFLEANYAYYVEKDYRRVMSLIPDAARQERFSPLQFSRQVLRGMALAQRGDRNEGGFWLDMLGGADEVYQRPLVELALAMNWERHGKLAQVFAKDSPVTDTTVRSILLQRSAGPGLLRAAARDTSRPQKERNLALYTLLEKDLTHGFYADFLRDRALLPANLPEGTALGDFLMADSIPLGVFRTANWQDGYRCGDIGATAKRLAANANDPDGLLCLGDYYRLNYFDYNGEAQPDPKVLGGVARQFPGSEIARQGFYQQVIANPRASADQKAYALYRAVWCYGPSGNNSCGGKDVPVSQRKAWFNQLKRQYPGSLWAKKLKYYW